MIQIVQENYKIPGFESQAILDGYLPETVEKLVRSKRKTQNITAYGIFQNYLRTEDPFSKTKQKFKEDLIHSEIMRCSRGLCEFIDGVDSMKVVMCSMCLECGKKGCNKITCFRCAKILKTQKYLTYKLGRIVGIEETKEMQKEMRLRRCYNCKIEIKKSGYCQTCLYIRRKGIREAHKKIEDFPLVPGCKMCGKKGRLDLHHDHETGETIGYLCGMENRGLGLFQDSILYMVRCAFNVFYGGPGNYSAGAKAVIGEMERGGSKEI